MHFYTAYWTNLRQTKSRSGLLARTGFVDWSSRQQRICKYHIWNEYFFLQILNQTFWRVN